MNLDFYMAFPVVVPTALLSALIPAGEYIMWLLEQWKSQYSSDYAFLNNLGDICEDHIGTCLK